jgi:hypothetical protein
MWVIHSLRPVRKNPKNILDAIKEEKCGVVGILLQIFTKKRIKSAEFE